MNTLDSRKQLPITVEDFAKILKRTLLNRFRECMRLQFKDRVSSGIGLTDVELRNVARTFAMGWSECYAAQGDTLRTHAWALAFGEITTEFWWPASEWRFWE